MPVVPVKRQKPKPKRYVASEDNAYMAFYATLRELTQEAMDRGYMTIKDLAEAARVHPNTVRNFLEGKTIEPRLSTVYRITQGVFLALEVNDPTRKRRRSRK